MGHAGKRATLNQEENTALRIDNQDGLLPAPEEQTLAYDVGKEWDKRDKGDVCVGVLEVTCLSLG